MRVLADAMFTAEQPAHAVRVCFAHPNFELRLYSPESGNLAEGALDRLGAMFTDFDGCNQRMHNKLVVVDGEAAVFVVQVALWGLPLLSLALAAVTAVLRRRGAPSQGGSES